MIYPLFKKVVFGTHKAASGSSSQGCFGAAKVENSRSRSKRQRFLDVIRHSLSADAQLARLQLESSEQSAVACGQSARKWTLQLVSLLGCPDADAMQLERSRLASPSLPPVNQLLAQVMTAHPALRVQHGKIDVGRQQYLIDRRTLLPTACLNTSVAASQDLNHFKGGTSHRRPMLFMSHLQVEIPHFDLGQRHDSAELQKVSAGMWRSAQ